LHPQCQLEKQSWTWYRDSQFYEAGLRFSIAMR
jgi:hypothetical protein